MAIRHIKVKVAKPKNSFSKDIFNDGSGIKFGIVRNVIRRTVPDHNVEKNELKPFIFVDDHIIFRDGGHDLLDEYDENGQVWFHDKLLAEIIFVTTAKGFDGLMRKYNTLGIWGVGQNEWARYEKGELPDA